MAVDNDYAITARFYDSAYAKYSKRNADVDFYLAQAREHGGPVLELGCGTGRVLLPIATAGLQCAGVDPSPAMLDVFRAKPGADAVDLHCAGMQSFDLGAHRFPFVYSAFRAFQHLLTVDDQIDCLMLARAHLSPGGVFAMDVFNPLLSRLVQKEEPEGLDLEFSQNGREIKRYTHVTRDHGTQTQKVRMRYVEFQDGAVVDETTTEFSMRWFFQFELEHLMYRAGFGEVEIFGDFDRSPVTGDSPHLLVVAQ